jgi:molybdopterin/thiamine biosynthesis adenylyltransferase
MESRQEARNVSDYITGHQVSARFDRHGLIAGWSQSRLAEASVAIAGMGALGNEVSRILAMSGVGRLIVCDPDIVEESNLSRTVLFRSSDIGKYKAEAAAGALKQLCPSIEVDARVNPLVQGIGLAELRDSSLVIGCLDSRASRLQLAGRCQLTAAKLIDAGTHPWGGEVRMFLDPTGPCYGCALGERGRADVDSRWSCLVPNVEPPQGAAAPSSSVVGSWAGALAIRAILGLSVPDGIVEIDLVTATSRIVKQRIDPSCPLHSQIGVTAKLKSGSSSRVASLLAEIGNGHGVFGWSSIQVESNDGPIRTENLALAPHNAFLKNLGVAPREILYLRPEGGLKWVELAE